ncbi:hypothetical protein [Phenylobacterium sp.]|uniref:hypothetical protein n=1 Tax=Phenylobacterium sp. TaxID=1871053 RepID=UPI003982F9CF
MGLALSACSQEAPKGVDKAVLDEAVSRAVGDPNSCVLIAEQGSGKVVYRYNTHSACGRALAACDAPGTRTAQDLVEMTARDGQARHLSCNTTSDASRGVGWASGVIPGRGLAYAAVMEGDRAFPGRMMADRLAGAFEKAGL